MRRLTLDHRRAQLRADCRNLGLPVLGAALLGLQISVNSVLLDRFYVVLLNLKCFFRGLLPCSEPFGSLFGDVLLG